MENHQFQKDNRREKKKLYTPKQEDGTSKSLPMSIITLNVNTLKLSNAMAYKVWIF